jgi:FkbM family methyltransferase
MSFLWAVDTLERLEMAQPSLYKESVFQSAISWLGYSTPYFPGKGRLWNLALDRFPELTQGEFQVERRHVTWSLDIRCVIQRSLFYLDVYEPWDTKFFLSMIKPGQCVVDVGANFGYYTLQAARLVGDRGSVLAFEPSTISYERLRRNLGLNGLDWVCPYKVALGNEKSVVRLAKPNVLNQGEQRILGGATPPLQSEEVSITTLDDFLCSHSSAHVDMIKVDIEGFEVEFLRGAKATIHEFQPILMVEINPQALGRNGSSADELLSELRELGYRCFTVRGANSSFIQFRSIKELATPPGEGHFFNVFAFPRASGIVPPSKVIG